jgi:hypothetical protein
MFENLVQENSFNVRGGMQWYDDNKILVVATDEDGLYGVSVRTNTLSSSANVHYHRSDFSLKTWL